jgi:predicted MFS family arabinose efflux permease
LLTLGTVLTAAGVLLLTLTPNPAAVLLGMTLFGTGFGTAQNASLTSMVSQIAPSGYSMVSALWNIAYDAGLALGAAGFGVLVAQTGQPSAYAITAVLVLATLASARPARMK